MYFGKNLISQSKVNVLALIASWMHIPLAVYVVDVNQRRV